MIGASAPARPRRAATPTMKGIKMPDRQFSRLWREAYDRDRPAIEIAQRLAAGDPLLALDPYALFRLAGRMAADEAAFQAAMARLIVPADVRAMSRLLDALPCC